MQRYQNLNTWEIQSKWVKDFVPLISYNTSSAISIRQWLNSAFDLKNLFIFTLFFREVTIQHSARIIPRFSEQVVVSLYIPGTLLIFPRYLLISYRDKNLWWVFTKKTLFFKKKVLLRIIQKRCKSKRGSIQFFHSSIQRMQINENQEKFFTEIIGCVDGSCFKEWENWG